ncbi:hypothetical protein LUZ63_016290 [Rhynchospora breviuscula]|uniref:BTB domain-containing protein n=1 Tax=Rhynchospora breviuscula TaxID=2022672 RepID=A0A9Q0C069_9POAL|nr:hypothetical protein LUZ63_016290 [Rhynchospora breviuscula]
MLQQNGVPFDNTFTTSVKIFKSNTDSCYFKSWGYPKFAKRCEFEASEYLKDDIFTIKCTVTVWKGTNLQTTTPYGIVVPPSNLNQHFVHLLEKEDDADVTFAVKGDKFKAHRCVLAARSAVFNAELFDCMKEKRRKTIAVEDIDAPVFKAMLYFIYSDSLPDFEENSDANVGEKKDVILMAQHLLVAADRYDLERLKLMCEDFLWKTLNVSTAVTLVSTLILAEQHNCNQLKAECLRFMRSPENFKTVALTDKFDALKTDFRSILKEM